MINWLLFNISNINFWYSVAGLAVLVVTVVLIFDYLCNDQRLYIRFVSPYIWVVIILTSFGSVFTSLLYSEVFGFVPCSLCWLQRIALYSQAILGLVAFRLKDIKYFPIYGIALSSFGLIVAVYQYIYQMLPQKVLQSGLVPCLVDGSADCGDKIINVFGFVTFPFLSAVLFAFLIILFLHLLRSDNKSLGSAPNS